MMRTNKNWIFLLAAYFCKSKKGFPSLFTEKYADFIEASRIEDSMERLKELKRLVSKKRKI